MDPKKKDDKNDAPKDEEKKLPATGGTGTALAVVDFGEDAGKGMQNITEEERKIPFLRLLQSNSPELDDSDAKYLPNARAGMFINTSTKQLYSKLIMVPCARDHKFIEYIPRAAGSGFVGIRKPDDEVVLMLRAKQGKFGKLAYNVTKRNEKGEALDGTEIVESFELYAIFIDPETLDEFRAIVSFTSTQIGKYQSFIDRYDGIKYQSPEGGIVKPPIWAHRWLLSSGGEKRKAGSFKGFVLGLAEKKPDGSDDVPVKSLIARDSDLYKAAAKFNAFVEAGKAEVDYGGVGQDDVLKAEDDVPAM